MYADFCYLFSRSDRFRFALLLVMMLGGSAIELLTMGAIPLYVSGLMNGPGTFISGYCSPDKFPLYGSFALLVLFMVRTGYFMILHACQERMLRNRQLALGSRVFRAHVMSPFSVARSSNSSVVVNNVASETERLVNLVLDPFISLVRNSIVALSLLGLMLYFDYKVSLFSFVVLSVFGGVYMFLSRRRMEKYGKDAHEARLCAVRTVTEGVGALKEATVTGVRRYFTERLHGALERQAAALKAYYTTQKNLWPAMELLTVVVLLGTFVLLLAGGRTIESAAPVLALIAVCFARLKGCVTEMLLFVTSIRYNSGVLKSVSDELRRLESAGGDEPSAVVKMSFNDRILVDGVSFTYPDTDVPVLENVSFEIRKGESIGFIGTTGSGKTTMVELLLGLFEPSGGRITVDGVDIKGSIAGWQAHLGFVPQDICLIDDSIRANVAFGVRPEDIDEDALRSALRTAQLEEFVSGLPDGDMTKVGENGALLSGGQRQRIGIARALYRKPDVIVFDEATSALDNETEAAVVSALESLRGGHTLITVAHRLTTIKSCGRIYRFDKGKVMPRNGDLD